MATYACQGQLLKALRNALQLPESPSLEGCEAGETPADPWQRGFAPLRSPVAKRPHCSLFTVGRGKDRATTLKHGGAVGRARPRSPGRGAERCSQHCYMSLSGTGEITAKASQFILTLCGRCQEANLSGGGGKGKVFLIQVIFWGNSGRFLGKSENMLLNV